MSSASDLLLALGFLGALVSPMALADDPVLRERAFPHNATSPRDPEQASCKACHGAVPATGTPPSEVSLHLGPEGTCTMCHREPKHVGADEHLNVVVPESVRGSLPDEVALLEGGRIACFSCHEPHDGLLAPVEGELPVMVSLPARDGALCRACHGAGPGRDRNRTAAERTKP